MDFLSEMGLFACCIEAMLSVPITNQYLLNIALQTYYEDERLIPFIKINIWRPLKKLANDFLYYIFEEGHAPQMLMHCRRFKPDRPPQRLQSRNSELEL